MAYGSPTMKRILAACVVVSLTICSSFAASPKVDAAIKTFKSVGADANKLKIFCDMKKAMDAGGAIGGYIKQLGTDFQTAWTADELHDGSADAEALRPRAAGRRQPGQ